MSELAGKDRRALRALGHHLKVVVQVGQQGITDALVAAAEQALLDHELIKCKVLEGAPLDRREAAAELAERTGAELAQVLGRTFLLYRPHPESPTIALPRAPAAKKPPAKPAAAPPPAKKPARKAAAKKTERPRAKESGEKLPPRRHR